MQKTLVYCAFICASSLASWQNIAHAEAVVNENGLTQSVASPSKSVAPTGDPVTGKKIFFRCLICHFADRPQHKIGPTLQNVMGRQAGTAPGYIYSKSMIDAGKNGLVWNRETLKTYLHSPHDLVKGTKMIQVHLKSESDIDDIIAYLHSTETK